MASKAKQETPLEPTSNNSLAYSCPGFRVLFEPRLNPDIDIRTLRKTDEDIVKVRVGKRVVGFKVCEMFSGGSIRPTLLSKAKLKDLTDGQQSREKNI